MKKFFLCIALSLSVVLSLSGQSFDEGLELYQTAQFEEAAEIFKSVNDERASLYVGKSYLALMEYSEALRYLYAVSRSSIQAIQQEAIYTTAIAHFGLRNFDKSLTLLHQLMDSDNRTGLRTESQRFYQQILQFLSINQRFETLFRLEYAEVRIDLVRNSAPFLDRATYMIMINELMDLIPEEAATPALRNELISRSSRQMPTDFRYLEAPDGTVYTVGVLLPTFDESDPDFAIPRNLFYGMTMAAQDFNSQNADQKVHLLFRDSAMSPDTAAIRLSEMIWTDKVDAILGPLFSEPAARAASIAEQYQTVMLAPLANSDSLSLDFNFTFQMNPTFEVHGKTMANHAVNALGLDSIAVITDRNSIGRSAALAFRYEAQRLGAHITYYIEEDFAATGYDFSEVSNVFTPDSILIDSLKYTPSEAIYAPFTGQASGTMMNLLMNNLEAMESDLIILGLEDWARAELSQTQLQNFNIYYSQAYLDPESATDSEDFVEEYRNRFGSEPDRFSMIGYDAADFLFRRLNFAGNPEYAGRAIRYEGIYNGLLFRADFKGKRVNQSLFIRERIP